MEFLQAALAASAQPAPNVYPYINYQAPLPGLPAPQLCRTSPLGSNVASSGSTSTVSPPPTRALMTLDVGNRHASAYTSTQWSAPAPLVPLSYLQPPAFPVHLTRTPTTRDSSAITNAPFSPFPTPPLTPASGSVCPVSRTRFPFPPLPSYHFALGTLPQQLPNSGPALPNYFIPLQPILPGTFTEDTPSPTPSPTHSPGSLLPTSFTPILTHTTYTDTVSHSLFLSYLDEVWPESSLRRSSSVIRSSLYDKIVLVLQGEAGAKGRERLWIKKSEFFLVEKEGRGSLLAVPAVRSRASSKRGPLEGDGGGKSASKRSSYKLVAKLEDFYYIISSYHNSNVGHHGIRKTYGLVGQLSVTSAWEL